ncbi:MAG: putative Ig domain-containing protein, partial [Candidatus Micrarchaeota archaeon]
GDKGTNESQTLTIQLTASDPDGDVLTFGTNAGAVLPSAFSFNPSSGLFQWTPTYLDSGVYSVTFNVSDGRASDEETIAITVINVNAPPLLMPIGDKAVSENHLLEFEINASDIDGDALVFSANNLPSGAVFNSTTRTFSWTPAFGQAGAYDNVQFVVSDGEFDDSENITITVNVNQPPVLAPIGDKTANATQTLTIQLTASDPENDVLIFGTDAGVVLPSSFTFNETTGLFTWTPSLSDLGGYNVSFNVTDSRSSDAETIQITVERGFVCGDATGNGFVEIDDVIYLINYLFRNGPVPLPLMSGDANNDGEVDISDIVYVINYLFYGGPAPCSTVAVLSSGSATLSLGSPVTNPDGTKSISVSESNSVGVAANKIIVAYDSSKATVLGIAGTGRTSGMDLIANDDKMGRLTIGILSSDGSKYIGSGSGAILSLKVKGTDTSSIRITYAESTDTRARDIKTSIVRSLTPTKTIAPVS